MFRHRYGGHSGNDHCIGSGERPGMVIRGFVGPYFRQSNADQLFTIGLFSVLDALMDTQMARALRPLPLAPDMVGALTLKRGDSGKVLECALAAERGEHCRGAPVDGGQIAELYRTSMEWGTESARGL